MNFDDEVIVVKKPRTTPTAVAKNSRIRQCWLSVTWILTFWIPTCCLVHIGRMKSHQVQIAWREKLALNIIILVLSGGLLLLIVGLGLILCPKTTALSMYEVEALAKAKKPIVMAYGHHYSISDIFNQHTNVARYISEGAFRSTTMGRDVSSLFKPLDNWNYYCNGLKKPESGWDNIARDIPEDAMRVWVIHEEKGKNNKPKNYLAMIKKNQKGLVSRDAKWIQEFLNFDPINRYLLIAYDRIYDVSSYISTVFQPDFLGPNFKQAILSYGQTGKDITPVMEKIKSLEGADTWQRKMNCIDGIFLVGVIDHRGNTQCKISDYVVLSASIFLIVIIGFKFFAALQFGSPQIPSYQDKLVIVCVTCFTENAESLQLTLNSIAQSEYDHKLLFVIADGMIKGSGNDEFTPDIVLRLLGHNRDIEPEAKAYQALGQNMNQLNFAKVYAGIYQNGGNSMPYIVVVKTGDVLEKFNPGNRGKRDSQLVLMQFLSRAHRRATMCPLERELYSKFIYNHGIDPRNFELLLWIDSDTTVEKNSIQQLVGSMAEDSSIAGICGETTLRNENKSFTTMIQVYEYFITHHLAKSFESLFGSVTCLPGCFSMYRIWSAESDTLFLVSEKVIQAYGDNQVNTLHLKNLLSLGEDRYLTTLMLKTFPEMKLKFNPDAKARTNAPEKWNVLLSQRRRWINSTVHNLMELIFLDNMCGCFIFSIRFVVIMDLFSTVMAPAGFLYVIWLITTFIVDENAAMPLISIIIIASIYGLQVVIFALKQEWQHLGWMVLYIIAMPMYNFWLPLYSFWHMDDFSWGSTRKVDFDGNQESFEDQNVEEFSPEMIEMATWDECSTWKNE